MEEILLSNQQLFMILREQGLPLNDTNGLLNALEIQYKVEISDAVKLRCSHFCSTLTAKWRSAKRTVEKLQSLNEAWLQCTFNFPLKVEQKADKGESLKRDQTHQFNLLSDRQKRRLTEPLRQKCSKDEILFAAKTFFNTSQQLECGKVLQILTEQPDKARDIIAFCEGKIQPPSFSKEKALALFISAKLSKNKYIDLRNGSTLMGAPIYPPYYQIQKAKRNCYPEAEAISVFENAVTIKLQALLDHTVKRIFEIPEVSSSVISDMCDDYVLISKWGMDSSTQNNYKLKVQETEENIKRPLDSSAFCTYFVPLRVSAGPRIIWENPRPSSTFFCRPIRFQFIKEDDEVIKNEAARMDEEIKNLSASKVKDGISVTHKMIRTMIDGKVCNTLADCKATQRCYICGAIGKELNNLVVKDPINDEVYQFGLGSLHAKIRSMEFLFHLACKDVPARLALTEDNPPPDCEKKSKKRISAEEKRVLAERKKVLDENYKSEMAVKKKCMQEKFRSQLGILIDFVKQGHGSTNDGNTARKFFEDPKITAEITGLDEELIRRFKIILEVISCGKEIDPDKYDMYAKDTARKFVNMYAWCNMSPTVHKLLLHGGEIIKRALLPIGKLSEDALEAQHREMRQIRGERSRKFDRKKCNEDIINGLLIRSDPFISSMRYSMTSRKKRKERPLDADATELLVSSLNDSGLGLEEEDEGVIDCESEEEEEEDDDDD